MAENETCSKCGARLGVGESGAACPKCLLAAGLAESEPRAGADTLTPEELSARFPNLEILEMIGQGGMGIVYRARQVNLDRIVALKILPPGIAGGPAFADRFAREAQTMARLDHGNIVRIYEFGESDGLFFLLMEFVDGLNLRQLMEAGGVEPREALSIIPQICDALQFAHDRGIVHRDVKPENVLLDRDGKVKITDFGLAKLLDGPPEGPGGQRITGTGQVMGTVHYMAPEQYQTPGDVDHRADIFSLGVVFYELLTGDLPIGRFGPPSANLQVDVRLDEVVLRALEKKREHRYQRVDMVRTEVDSILDEPAASPRPPAELRDEPAPRLCMLALFGFLCAPAALLLPVLGATLGAMSGKGAPILLMVLPAGLLLPLGFILSLSGWVVIARSEGRRKGLAFAVLGTIAPGLLFFLFVGLGFFYMTVQVPAEEEPDVAVYDAPVEAVDRPDDRVIAEHHRFTELMQTLVNAETASGPRPPSIRPFYARVDAARISQLDPATRDRLGAAGYLGLPLLQFAEGDLYLDRYDLHHFSSPLLQMSAMVTSEYGKRRLAFDLVKEDGQLRFALSPVRGTETELTMENNGAEGAARLFLGIWLNLWRRGALPPEFEVLRSLIPTLYPPSRKSTLLEAGIPLCLRDGATGRYGLLFMAPAGWPGAMGDYRVESITLAEGRTTARVVLQNGDHAPVEFRMVLENGRWWLDGEGI